MERGARFLSSGVLGALFVGVLITSSGCGMIDAEAEPAGSRADISLQLRVMSPQARRAVHSRGALVGDESDYRPLLFSDPDGVSFSLIEAEMTLAHISIEFKGEGCAEVASRFKRGGYSLDCRARRLSIDGPFEVDLMTGEVRRVEQPAAPGALALPALDYRRILLVFGGVKRGALQAQASFELNSSIHRLKMDFSLPSNLQRAVIAPAELKSKLLVSLNLSAWLEQIPVGYCTAHGYLRVEDGVVYLDQTLDQRAFTYFYRPPPRDCQDAQARFLGNFSRSLSVRAD